ncbi:MAG: dicarboxylate/amino acid:cation symporter [Deltaproteobacteria bacterium]|nr:dicarboxylate/amino acid:cation symporter [Deltaproteobacteria bacterium]
MVAGAPKPGPSSRHGRSPRAPGIQLHTKILLGMFLGAVLGFLVGPNSAFLEQTGVELSARAEVLEAPGEAIEPTARGLTRARIVGRGPDDPSWLAIEWTVTPARILQLEAAGVKPVSHAGEAERGWVKEGPHARTFSQTGRRLVDSTEWIGALFLALIKMVVVPLVFLSLVVGVASLGDLRALGRLGGRTLGYFMLTTLVAIVIGVALAKLVGPGRLLSSSDREALLASYGDNVRTTIASAAKAPSMTEQLIAIVPTNPAAALASGDMLQIIFFALMLGLALTMIEAEKSKLVVDVFSRLNDAVTMLVHLAMKVAPFGVAALLFKVVGTTGLSVLVSLAAYALVVIAGLTIHAFVTYGAVVRFGSRLRFSGFLSSVKDALLVAFSTSSSSATLPVTMEACEQNLGVSPKVASFVLPLGATVNMDGTALYQGVATIFIAQIYGIELGLGEQATVVVSATLASVGAAGVPGAGMITLAMVLTAVGVPTEGLALILGVDRLLDMFRTTVNVAGDCTAAVLMARLEGDDVRAHAVAT